MTEADKEFSAMQTIFRALNELPPDAQSRVISYIIARLEITAPQLIKRKGGKAGADEEADEEREEEQAKLSGSTVNYSSFAELFDAAQPATGSQKALVGAYWIQTLQGSDSFDSQRLNSELKNLGHGLTNITAALDALKTQNPALVLQTKKAGTSQQARKTYKLTVAGVSAVRAMING